MTFYFLFFFVIFSHRLRAAETALSAAIDALDRGVWISTSDLSTLKADFKAINSELRETALRRVEEQYISNARGRAPCWRLLKFLSRQSSTPNIPPAEITNHFKEVYYKRSHPACLRYLMLNNLILISFPTKTFMCFILFYFSALT